MKRTVFLVCCAALIVFSMFFDLSFCSAGELSPITVKKIEEAIEKIENPARGKQKQGYKEIKNIGPATAPYLIKELKDKSIKFESRKLICDILGEFKAKNAVPSLVYTLKNRSYTVRAAACEALGKIGDPSAVEPLIAMLADEDPHVRAAAVDALMNFDDSAIPAEVAKLLNDNAEDVRKFAITLLDDKLDPGTAGAIREAFQRDKSSSVRMVAARALGRLKDVDSVDILMEAVTEDGSKEVRRESVIALGKIGDKKAIPVLIEGLKDDYKDVQSGAAGSLKELTGQDFGRSYDDWSKWHDAR